MAKFWVRFIKAASRQVSLLALICTLVGCGGDASSGKSFSSDVSASFQQVLDEKRVEDGAAGVIALVRCDDGREWIGTSGVAETTTHPQAPNPEGRYDWVGSPIDPQLLFRVGSLTKTFTAALILKLADEGRLTLEDTVEQWLPGAVVNGSQINIRQLLNHTSGVAEIPDHPTFESRPWTPDELVALIAGAQPQFQPGQDFTYTNMNYILLGAIAEKIEEQPYETLVKTKLIDPLGLSHTYVPTTPDFPEEHVQGYEQAVDGSYSDVTALEQPTAPWAAGSIISNISDVAVWIRAFADGSMLRPETHAEQLDFVSLANGAGYGLGTISFPDGRVGHNGSIKGFRSSSWRVGNYVVVALTNSRSDNDPTEHVTAALTEMIQSGQTE